jgi:hypothetical protein
MQEHGRSLCKDVCYKGFRQLSDLANKHPKSLTKASLASYKPDDMNHTLPANDKTFRSDGTRNPTALHRRHRKIPFPVSIARF